MTMQMNEFFYGASEPHWQQELSDDYRVDYQRPYASYTADFDLPTYEFRVPMCCSKCEEKVREELLELEGVVDIFVDLLSERAAVTGLVDPYHALKKMKRIKKKSEFWDESEPTLKQGHSHDRSSRKKHSSHGSHGSHDKKHHPRYETTYRSSSSQVSYNRDPSRRELTRSSSSRGLPHRESSRGWSSRGLSYRSTYNCDDDEGSYCDFLPSSSSFAGWLPRSRSLHRDESGPPYAQNYYTEECYPESNASYAHY